MLRSKVLVLMGFILFFFLTINHDQETSGVEWKKSEHTKADLATDAFGELEFTGAGPASRAKVSRRLHFYKVTATILFFSVYFDATQYSKCKSVGNDVLH